MNRILRYLVSINLTLLAITSFAESSTPANGMEWYTQARALQDQQQYDAAMDAFQHAIDESFQPAGALMRMAQILAAQGQLDDAVMKLQKAYELNPMTFGVLLQIGGVPELVDDERYTVLLAEADKARYPCKSRPEAAQFDFWLGDWQVSSPQGQVVGENHVTSDLEGCVVRESWTSAFGSHGTSVNFYDPATRKWHQVWTSDIGSITHYVGMLVDGQMRFEAKGFGDANGESRYRRMTFTPNPDGSVRQFIEDSVDGQVWTVSFDGLYTRLN